MALQGSLRSMPLTDLLQWLGSSGKTGTLRIERSKIVKFIVFREGAIVSCSSDDPPELLGHYLVAQGKISEDVLRRALACQTATREHLGKILVDAGSLSAADLTRLLAAKAEETIFSLFDWEEGEFQFDESLGAPAHVFPIQLRVDEVLLRGLKRFDEVKRIRAVFNDPGIVLRRTDRQPPPEVFETRMARGIYEMVSGDRTVAEILLHAHGSEYLVTKFLFELFRNGMIEIAEVRPVASPAAAEAKVAATMAAAGTPARYAGSPSLPFPDASPPTPAGSQPSLRPDAHDPEAVLAASRALMGRGEYEGALELLNACYRAHPGDESLRRLVAEAEAAYVERSYRHLVPAGKVPVLSRPIESLAGEDLSPVEYFLLSRMNGTWDVRSIIQITPIREVEALRTLARMREKGYLEFRDPR